MNYGNEYVLNNFKQFDARGREDGKVCNNVFECIFKDETSDKVTAGDMVKLVDYGNKLMPTVAKVKATDTYDENTMYGFIPLTRKNNIYSDNDIVPVCWSGVHMRMITERYVGCGQTVYYDATTSPTAAKIILSNLDFDGIKAMGEGQISLFVNGTRYTFTMNFGAIQTFEDIATIMSNNITYCSCMVNGENSLSLYTNNTGSQSSLTVDKGNPTIMYNVFNFATAEEIAGQDSGGDFGKVYVPINEAPQGVIKCGIAKTSGGENELITVIIK